MLEQDYDMEGIRGCHDLAPVFCFSQPSASGSLGAALFLRSFGSHSNFPALQQVEAQKRPKLASLPSETPFANRPSSLSLIP